jgi:hypothetical protein
MYLLAAGALLAAAAAPAAGPPTPLDRKGLAAHIDGHLAAGWQAAAVQPAPLADDPEFVRRVYLDLAGRIPSVAEARAFLDDARPDKRARLVDALLDGPRYVTHWARVWRSLLLPEASTNPNIRFQGPNFESWVRRQLATNAPYDAMVRDLLTTSVANRGGPFGPQGTPNPVAFYMAKEVKPENLAAATSRLFLGFRLECAQCHNHPFAKWKKDQFWGFAAFFAGLQRQGGGDFSFPTGENAARHEITIPNTEKVVQATFPDGKQPKWKDKQSGRQALADWVTAADNPYFARAAANRLWCYFFGAGIIDPVDEMVGGEYLPSHPALLDELAQQFAMHHFDLKYMIRALTETQAYQRTSARTHPGQDDPRLFARMALRGLSPEQLFDSIGQATGFRDNNNPQNFFPQGPRADFQTLFASQGDKPTDHHTSILQALALMNGQITAGATDLQNSVTLAAVADAPFLDTAGRVEALFLATLGRRPTTREQSRFVAYVERGGSAPASAGDSEKRYQRALADVFWALLNTGEFMLNH